MITSARITPRPSCCPDAREDRRDRAPTCPQLTDRLQRIALASMIPTERYEAVARHRDPTPAIILQKRGSDAVVRLDAAVLVAQYAVTGTRTLVVLDDDTPYEERLHLVLLEGERVLDHLVIGGPYASGVFRPEDGSGDALHFRFESDVMWTLSVGAAGRRGLGGLPDGARRRTGLLAPRYLMLGRGG